MLGKGGNMAFLIFLVKVVLVAAILYAAYKGILYLFICIVCALDKKEHIEEDAVLQWYLPENGEK